MARPRTHLPSALAAPPMCRTGRMARYASSDPCRMTFAHGGAQKPLTKRRPARKAHASGVHTGALGDRGHGRRHGTRHRPRSTVSFPATAPEVRPRRSIRRRQRLHRRRAADRGRTPSLPSCALSLRRRHGRSVSPRSQRGTAASAWAWFRYTCRAQLTASRPEHMTATTRKRYRRGGEGGSGRCVPGSRLAYGTRSRISSRHRVTESELLDPARGSDNPPVLPYSNGRSE